MAAYIVSSHNPNGRYVTQRIDGESGDAVHAQLRAQGHTHIVLHTDDVEAALIRPEQFAHLFSPREMLILARSGFAGFFFLVLRKFLVRAWVLDVIVAGWVAWGAWRLAHGQQLLAGEIVVAAFLVGLLALLPVSLYFGVAERRRRLFRAIAWGRWHEALERLRVLAPRLPTDRAAFLEAQALAGLGRLQDALAVLEPFADGKWIPPWIYWAQVSEIRHAAKDRAGTIAAKKKAVSLAPEYPSLLVGLALALLRHRQERERARQLIQAARKHTLSDTLGFAVSLAEGLLALEDGHAQEAREHLERSLAEMGPIRRLPASQRAEAEIHAYLTLACAATAHVTEARRHFRRAEPMLRAHHAEELLRRCAEALA